MPQADGQQADQAEDGHHEEADQADEAQETDDAREAQAVLALGHCPPSCQVQPEGKGLSPQSAAKQANHRPKSKDKNLTRTRTSQVQASRHIHCPPAC